MSEKKVRVCDLCERTKDVQHYKLLKFDPGDQNGEVVISVDLCRIHTRRVERLLRADFRTPGDSTQTQAKP